MKKFLSIILVIALSFSGTETIHAETSEEPEKEVKVVFTEWDNLNTSTYAVEKFNEAEMAMYNKIKEKLDYYLRTNADFENYRKGFEVNDQLYDKKIYCEEFYDDSETLTDDQLSRILFSLDVCKYYFWDQQYHSYSKTHYISMHFFSDFADGDYRAKVSRDLDNKINNYTNLINSSCNDNIEKIVKLNDIICDMTDYDHNYVDFPKQKKYAEYYYPGVFGEYCVSMYAPLTGRNAICSAYSNLFTIMATKLGFETLNTYNYRHAWNKIKVNDVWYVVDVTSNDSNQISGRTYCLLVNDKTKIAPELIGYSPVCEHDYFKEKREAELFAEAEAKRLAEEQAFQERLKKDQEKNELALEQAKLNRLALEQAEDERLNHLLPIPKGLKVKKTKNSKKLVVTKFTITNKIKKEMDDEDELSCFQFEFSNTKKFKNTYRVSAHFGKNYIYLNEIPKYYRKYVRVRFKLSHTYTKSPENPFYVNSSFDSRPLTLYSKYSKIYKIK